MSDAIYEGEWAIVVSSSGKYLGKVLDENQFEIKLGPVYDIKQLSMQRGGEQAIDIQLMPFLLIAEDIELGIMGEVAVLKLSALGAGEREIWFDRVRNVRAGMMKIKAQRAGLSLVPGKPKA
jgi:hypothetical protein